MNKILENKKIVLKILLLVVALIFVITTLVLKKNEDKNSSEYLVYESFASENGENLAETRVYKGNMPELYINGEKKTENEYAIEYSPRINDNGIYAYVLYNESTSASKVYVNDKEVHSGSFNKIVYMDNINLFFTEADKEKDEGVIYLYELESNRLQVVSTLKSEFVNNMTKTDTSAFFMELWKSTTNETCVAEFILGGGGRANRNQKI